MFDLGQADQLVQFLHGILFGLFLLLFFPRLRLLSSLLSGDTLRKTVPGC